MDAHLDGWAEARMETREKLRLALTTLQGAYFELQRTRVLAEDDGVTLLWQMEELTKMIEKLGRSG